MAHINRAFSMRPGLHPYWGTGRDKPTGNKKGVKKMKKTRKITRDKKGIDTILAALLMVVIVVVAAVMVYAWATGLLGTLLVTPQTGKESLIADTTPTFTSGTNVTVNIRNAGSAATTLQTYYVKDNSGDQYSKTTWSGPTIAANGVIATNFPIGASCSGCSLTGSAFTFVSGNSYTITVVTSRNNQFTFTATR
jgi:FlaG/FlaF family flagellin (archaellin)